MRPTRQQTRCAVSEPRSAVALIQVQVFSRANLVYAAANTAYNFVCTLVSSNWLIVIVPSSTGELHLRGFQYGYELDDS